MLKKKSGASFKPKARRNVPSASRQGPERSATAEVQSVTPTPTAAPAPAPASLAVPPTAGDHPTPTPSLSQSLTPDAHSSTQVAEPSLEAPASLSPVEPSSTAAANPPQPDHGPGVGAVELGDHQEQPVASEPSLKDSGVTKVREEQAKEAQAAVAATTQSTRAPGQLDAASSARAPLPKAPTPPSSKSTATTPPTAAPTESNIDPALDGIPSVASAKLSTTPATPTSTRPPVASQPSSNVASSTDAQPNPTSSEQPTEAPAQPAAQAVTPPAEATADQPKQSIEAAGEPVPEPSTAPKPKQTRKRKPAAEAAGEDGAAGVPKKRVRKKKAAPVAEAQVTQAAATPRKRARKSKGTEEEQVRNEAVGSGEDDRQTQTPARHRSATPDDAEKIEVDIRQVKMGDLIKDMRIGKKFSRHDELLERERMKRQKNYMAKKLKGTGLDSLASSNDGSRASSTAATPAPDQGEAPPTPREDQPAATVVAPQFQIINGQIVLNSNSLQFDRHAHAAERAGEMEEEIEDEFTHHTTSSTYMKRQTKSNNWTPVETEKFYHALSMFGTDFQIISRMFPDKTRRHIKLKFNREERLHPQRVNAALVGTKTVAMDMDEYKSHTGQEYETVDAITAEHRRAEEEFEAEQRRIDEAAANEAKRKRDELYGDRDDDGDSDDGAAAKRGKDRSRSKKATLAGLRA